MIILPHCKPASRASVATVEIFRIEKSLVGEPPQTRKLLDKMSRAAAVF